MEIKCKMKYHLLLAVTVFAIWFNLPNVSGHGRLVDPPSRSSMWRFGFKTKPNYNDNELFCGGFTVHWQKNGGKCGVCGDPWHVPPPRPNEAGGTYGRGIIVRKYAPGQVITSTVDITANHRGFFEFKICPHNNPTTVVTQECLDKTPLLLADGTGYKYYPTFGTGPFQVKLKLPDHLTCSQCVFQWTYTAGNNWGQCDNRSSKVGCGPQETFRGCADVAIGDYETNEISSFTLGPPGKSSIRPSYEWSSPTRPNYRKKPSRRPSITAIKPYYVNRGSIPKQKSTTKRPKWQNYPSTKKTTPRPRQTSAPKYSIIYKKNTYRPWYSISTTSRTTYRPWYNNTPKKSTQRQRYNNAPKKSTQQPWYSSTPKKIMYQPKTTKKQNTSRPSRPSKKPKPPRKQKPILTSSSNESQNDIGGCRAVGAWKSVSGIASWCNVNCPRGYCPPSHCDCS